MDGEGRLVRSDKRSSGPRHHQKTDLKAAAKGVRILLREWLDMRARKQAVAAAAKEARRRTTPPSRALIFLERFMPRRIGVAATVAILFASVTLGVVKGGHIDEMLSILNDARNAAANAAGFRIAEVAINGRKQLTQDEILAIGSVTGRSSLLFLDAATVRDKLKANPWIADANVLKLYPNRLQIDVTERKAFAVWQQDGRLQIIADDGAVLESYIARRFTGLPLVVGKGAETHAKDFLALLDRYPQVRSVTKAAIYVGERRWNLRLKDGLDIRLPENDIGNALALLSKLDNETKLFSRDIVAVDLRLPDRVTVRLSEEAGKARDELFKDKKPKRKANDA
jgi:cell division protein FtsQ